MKVIQTPLIAKSARRFGHCIAVFLWLFFLPSEGRAREFLSLAGKHIVGYQGWFGCPTDSVDPRWAHWFGGNESAPRVMVDLWPDLSEFDREELCATDLRFPSGGTVHVFSSQVSKTVHRHFHWMNAYGIDGAAISRFLSQISNPVLLGRTDLVLRNVRDAAEAENVGFFVMYDLSGLSTDNDVQEIIRDWKRLVNVQRLTASPSYMRDRGRPIVALWGLGIGNRPASPQQAMTLVNYFKEEAGSTVLGGVPAFWRTLGLDSRKEPEWKEVFRAFDILSPWTVGRYRDPREADTFARDVVAQDLMQTHMNGQEYLPVIFPGFSWHNLQKGRAPLDQIQRLCGEFYSRQANNIIQLGVKSIFTAMFDELDEGTAIFKVIRQPEQLPIDVGLLAPDRDCADKGSDLYLRAAGKATNALRRRTYQR